MLVDTHAHLNLKAFSEDFEAVLQRCFDLGVTVVNVGTDISTSKKAVEIMERHSQGDRLQDTLSASQGLGISPRGGELYAVYAAVGLHPSHTYDNPYLDENESTASIGREIFDYEAYKKLALHPQVVGIGECGLDYYRLPSSVIPEATSHDALIVARAVWDPGLKIKGMDSGLPAQSLVETGMTTSHELIKQQQKEAFLLQIKLAKELDKALIIHCRPSEGSTDAYDDVLEILENNEYGIKNKDKYRFEIHSYTGNWETAQKFLALGGYLGFNGIITFGERKNKAQSTSAGLSTEVLTKVEALAKVDDRTGNMEEVVRNTPLDRILLETDSPYLSPKPLRGKRNEPVNVKLVAEKIAEIKGLEYDEVVRQTTENASVFFHLK